MCLSPNDLHDVDAMALVTTQFVAPAKGLWMTDFHIYECRRRRRHLCALYTGSSKRGPHVASHS